VDRVRWTMSPACRYIQEATPGTAFGGLGPAGMEVQRDEVHAWVLDGVSFNADER
jgi:hypothetical protein